MSTRDVLLRELLQLTSTHKEGFKSGTPESQRINTLIDELAPLSRYPDALNHPEIFRGHWAADYHSIGRLVGGKDAQDEGVGVTVSRLQLRRPVPARREAGTELPLFVRKVPSQRGEPQAVLCRFLRLQGGAGGLRDVDG